MLKILWILLFKRNKHQNIMVKILYLEKISILPVLIIFKILRKIVLQALCYVQMHPNTFTKEGLITFVLSDIQSESKVSCIIK